MQQVDDVKVDEQSQEETFLIRRKIGLKGVIGNRANDYIEIPKTANQTLIEEINPINVNPTPMNEDAFDSMRKLKEEDPII